VSEQPIDLRPWGYAPGGYLINCMDCTPNERNARRLTETADRRATRCKRHAEIARKSSLDNPPQPDPRDATIAALRAEFESSFQTARMERDAAVAEARAAKAEAERLRDVLTAVQHREVPVGFGKARLEWRCPVCRHGKPTHDTNCIIANALAANGAEKGAE
jgi:rubrerythrin